MKIGPFHLTFCTNIFPADDWLATFDHLKTHLPALRERVSPNAPMGVGLRLSNLATRQLLEQPSELKKFKSWLDDHGLYVFTLNGFVHGKFHQLGVKESVYEPNWCDEERVRYTIQLMKVLQELLPEGVGGSISTVPLGFNGFEGEKERRLAAQNLLAVAEELQRIKDSEGKEIFLALEPEPLCALETTDQLIQFFVEYLYPTEAAQAHLGICFDCCHAAIEFEDLSSSLRKLRARGIQVPKMQLSSAMVLKTDLHDFSILKPFADPQYLHQVVAQYEDGSFGRWPDLGVALQDPSLLNAQEWRVHYHLPIDHSEYGSLKTTQSDLAVAIETAKELHITSHFEVETYTYSVLPKPLRNRDINDHIASELEWAKKELS